MKKEYSDYIEFSSEFTPVIGKIPGTLLLHVCIVIITHLY